MAGSDLLLAGAGLLIAAAIVFAVLRKNPGDNSAQAALIGAVEAMSLAQAEQAGRLAAMSEAQARAQADMRQTLEQRLDGVTKRLGDGLATHTEKTGKTMAELHERLGLIDAAQKNLSELSENVVGLQQILDNKQRRGAFGELRLEELVRDSLPPDAYEFQATLSNGRRADCLLKLPNPPGAIAVDSKFPLESYRALDDAGDDALRERNRRAFGTAVLAHVRHIAERYIVPGETAESAFMFVPSEAVYAELHARLPEVVEKSYRTRVLIVSPTTVMALLNTMRAVLKDARMREQAGVIQTEVQAMQRDIELLDERVGKLKTHFGQANTDIDNIFKSTTRITRRAERIEDIQLSADSPAAELPAPPDEG